MIEVIDPCLECSDILVGHARANRLLGGDPFFEVGCSEFTADIEELRLDRFYISADVFVIENARNDTEQGV